MQSPLDPIFFLHHCNVDRLWHAWALPDGRTMPVSSSPYWTGAPTSFVYAPGLTMPKVDTYSPRRAGTVKITAYDYDNTSRPTSLPPQAQLGRIIRAKRSARTSTAPAGRLVQGDAGSRHHGGERAIGGVKSVALNEQSISALVTAEASSVQSIQDVITTTEVEFPDAGTTSASAPADTSASTSKARKFRSVKVVFDNVAITSAGAAGGYFYKVYLNLPENADIDAVGPAHFLGTLGAFEIASEAHHGSVTLEYPATGAMVKMRARPTREHVISFVRVDGTNAPTGQVIMAGEMRVELSTETRFHQVKYGSSRGAMTSHIEATSE